MVSTAFKPSQEIYSLTPHLLPSHPTFGNFSEVISGQVTGGIGSVWLFFRNSLLVTLSTVVFSSLVSLLASVAVARFRFRLRASFLVMLLIVQMIPAQALIIALFLDFKRLNLLQNPARPGHRVLSTGPAGIDLDAPQLRRDDPA